MENNMHMDTLHPVEDGSQRPSSGVRAPQEHFGECPIEGCGEIVSLAEIDYHMDLHLEEERQSADSPITQAPIEPPGSTTVPASGPTSIGHAASDPTAEKKRAAVKQWNKLLSVPPAKSKTEEGEKRLGKAELGKYAHEQQMPDWLVSLLHRGGEVKSDGVIYVLEQLLRQSKSTQYAYLCSPAVQHVSKLKKEGGFCGYRNIQMMVSYIIGANSHGKDAFQGRLPTIFEIQEFIEKAWDLGINAQGRLETGGIKGTRKCMAQGFKDPEPGKSEAKLMLAVEQYFRQGAHDEPSKVTCTTLPPIYFQHAGKCFCAIFFSLSLADNHTLSGHSLTIVGFERQKHGPANILVFDPMFRDPPALSRLIGQTFKHKTADESLKPYRRGAKYLRRYREFELLRLDGPETRPATTQISD
ncbi:putative peptidase family C78 [Colletotrichum sublineola]|uniref:Putative peptidase family C78 n=1 Tax=Colletotrichum sublineola TaxID=1173701 RepID=A0A066XTF8_COLSU|nr:putative peptidase family C78 [Colletotrichum sublineola]